MRIISFYLPQFHPIPENDAWWGKGFTEWTNVAKAKPLFKGHHQPQIPADLGFYDLRLEETRIAQAELAGEHGISGFCYYHYWFNGKMLLERPFNEVLKSGKPDFPFCLCWANENWTRRWDGADHDILIGQNYQEYDAEQHVAWLSKAFSDTRYIKINGKPLFLIYCADHIPAIREKIITWKNAVILKGYPGLYLCAVKSHRFTLSEKECLELGFDALVDFQPNPSDLPKRNNYVSKIIITYMNKLIDLLNMQKFVVKPPTYARFDYSKIVDAVAHKPVSLHKTFPCVFPNWDNTARKNQDAAIIQNNDAELYAQWLHNALWRVKDHPLEEQIVFVNAWNEWAEGCHLEPDLINGRKFLQATRDTLNRFDERSGQAIIGKENV
jgi:lipopolysaccharide biosynthesis protein